MLSVLKRKRLRRQERRRLKKMQPPQGLPPMQVPARSCVMIQIDGLAHKDFTRALGLGKLPFLRRLLSEGKARSAPWRCMLPSSTSAFQTGLFYGNNDNIPGFFWYGRREGRRIKMNSTEDSARVEAEVRQRVAPFEGLLQSGSAYSSLFSGGARNTFLTFSTSLSPRLNLGLHRGWLGVFILCQLLLFVRVAYYSAIEIALGLYDMVRGLITERNKFLEMKFIFPRIASVVLCREISTLATILDIYRGTGPIYLNHFAYDEHAHHRGPSSLFAYWTLKGLDASIRRVWEAAELAEQLNIRKFDVFVWSDHGQTPCVPFQELHQQTPDRHFDLIFQSLYADAPQARTQAEQNRQAEKIAQGRILRGQKRRRPDMRIDHQLTQAERILAFLPRPLRVWFRLLIKPARRATREAESPPLNHRTHVHVVSTGPVANLCLDQTQTPMTYEQWLTDYPLFLEAIAAHEGVGFTLIRTQNAACQVGCGGQWFDLMDENAVRRHCPDLVEQVIADHRAELLRWANMPEAGDMILFGQRGSGQPVITYSYEHGGHSGPSPDEMTPFIIIPTEVGDQWPEVIAAPKGARLTLEDLHERLCKAYCTGLSPNRSQCRREAIL